MAPRANSRLLLAFPSRPPARLHRPRFARPCAICHSPLPKSPAIPGLSTGCNVRCAPLAYLSSRPRAYEGFAGSFRDILSHLTVRLSLLFGIFCWVSSPRRREYHSRASAPQRIPDGSLGETMGPPASHPLRGPSARLTWPVGAISCAGACEATSLPGSGLGAVLGSPQG